MSEQSCVTPDLETRESTPMAQVMEAGTGSGTGELPGIHQSYRLYGRNYLQWAQLVQTFLKGKGKNSHLTSAPPKPTDPALPAWEVEDAQIMSWLWNAMQLEVSKNYMFLGSAREIWETIRQTYSKIHDASVIF